MPVRLPPSRLVVALLLLALPLHAQGGPLSPPSNGGYARFDWLLQRLGESRRVLAIAAHPDDEDTELLALAARGWGADAAYLSLTRGEGGQNLIGAELGAALGLLRTQELLAARALDGAQQYFTRAFDFGYTRSLAETERLWTADSILKDVVRVLRRFRPHVVVAVFSGTARDGHGQHQYAGRVARAAFEAAGDPARFPELLTEEGLEPWTPLKLYTSTRFRPEASTLRMPTAVVEPRSGRTVHQIAMESRSRHRSQDFGVLQALEDGEIRLALERPQAAGGSDGGLFDGVPNEAGWLGRFADSLRRTVAAATMGDAVAMLADALHRAGRDGVPEEDRALLEEALSIAAGIVLDARTTGAPVVPGGAVDVAVDLRNGGPQPVAWRTTAVIARADGWNATAAAPVPAGVVPGGGFASVEQTVPVPPAARPTRPYFLDRPLAGALYDWSGAPPRVRGLPHAPPPLTVRITLDVAGVAVTLEREVTVRERDQATGEIRRPVSIVPAVAVHLEPDTTLWPLAEAGPRPFTVTLVHHAPDTTSGVVRLLAGRTGEAAAERPFALARAGDEVTVTLPLARPGPAGDYDVRAEAVTADGRRYSEGPVPVAYEHVRPAAWVRPATSRVRVADAALPATPRIGYVRGASDRVPEALARAGVDVTLLDAAALARGDLGRYAVIVVGSRAYETDSALVRHNARLLDWVRAGGRLVVQYQQYQYVRGGFAPYPLEIASPHDRVTDEASPVRILDPDHGVFRSPNRIGSGDWEGWPQERGLYFPRTWDARYEALLEMVDPEGRPVRGGLLVARVGRGTYVYTGLSFFRALPAGVPGAFRLFFNLLDGW